MFDLELRASAQNNGPNLDHSGFQGLLERMQTLIDMQIRRLAQAYENELQKEIKRVENENRV